MSFRSGTPTIYEHAIVQRRRKSALNSLSAKNIAIMQIEGKQSPVPSSPTALDLRRKDSVDIDHIVKVSIHY